MLIRARHDAVGLALALLIFLLAAGAGLSGIHGQGRRSGRSPPPPPGEGILLNAETGGHNLVADGGEGRG